MNLVLITIDCLRADHVGFLGYPLPTTPNLDALASNSLVFEQAHVCGSPTFYSFTSILASRYPLSLGRDMIGQPPGSPGLASSLKDSGYCTAGFVAGNPYLSHQQGYQQGFDVWEDWCSAADLGPAGGRAAPPADRAGDGLKAHLREAIYRVPGGKGLYDELGFEWGMRRAARTLGSREALLKFPDAPMLTDRALSWLADVARPPFFLWLHYMDAHQPRYPARQSLAALGAGGSDLRRQAYLNAVWLRSNKTTDYLSRFRDDMMTLYDAGIRDVDSEMPRLFDGLARSGGESQTVVVVLGDHGEEFLEHGAFGHNPPKLYDELTHVPLLVRAPGRSGTRISTPFSSIDLVPTLLDCLGLPRLPSAEGVSRWEQWLNGTEWSGAIISEAIKGMREPWQQSGHTGASLLAVRDLRYKLMLDFGTGREDLFDLMQDPVERDPLPANALAHIRAPLLRAAQHHLARRVAASTRDGRLEARVTKIAQSLREADL